MADADDATLAKLLDRYVYVKAQDTLYDRVARAFVTPLAVRRSHLSEMPVTDGRRRNPDDLLFETEAALRADTLTYRPGSPLIIEEGGVRLLNSWTGTTLIPAEGDPGQFISHLSYLLDGDETALGFLLDWCAHLIQRP